MDLFFHLNKITKFEGDDYFKKPPLLLIKPSSQFLLFHQSSLVEIKEAASKETQSPLQLLSAVATGQHFLKNINNHKLLR